VVSRPYIADQIGEWCVSVGYDELPENVCCASKRAILDTVGVVTAGGRHPLINNILRLVESHQGPSMSIGGKMTSPQMAALVNGAAAHVYDFDDTSYTGIMHGSAVILPAILAVADETGCSREELITAFVVGSEVCYTLADFLTHSHYFKGWWSTGTLGLIGATAAVSKLYGLSSEKISTSIGLAVAGSCGTKAIVGTDGKSFFVGEAARRAVDFAKVAATGISGPRDAIESSRGFVPLLNDGIFEKEQIATLGQRWRLIEPGLLFKRYPVCSAAHSLIQQTASLVDEAQCKDSDVASVVCDIPDLVNISLVYDKPENIQQAQFSLPFSVACALRFGAVRLCDLSSEVIASPETLALMGLVSKTVDPELSTDEMRKKYPESARVTLILKDGQKFEGFCGEAYGMPGNPLSEADLIDKFSACLRFAGQNSEMASRIATEILSQNFTGSGRGMSDIVKQVWSLPILHTVQSS
jgi:2-methylcitrate dehydratase PrpD